MKLPIVAYGDPVLRKVADEIDEDYPNLKQLIADMFETMYAANGVGLAAPQVGLPIRLFVIDATPFAEDVEEEKEILRSFKRYLSIRSWLKKRAKNGLLAKVV